MRSGRISHAQLFLGNDGYGALALAIAYAQYINCENPSETDSCGVCHNCRKYAILQHPDLHFSLPVPWATSEEFIKVWIDFYLANPYPTLPQWYNHIGIDKQGIIKATDAQNIIDILNYKSYESPYKVLIMWHAENLNITAANKLLKLIEEPTPATLILLVTHSADAILKTILSRTQQVIVPPIEAEAIAATLTQQKGIPEAQALEYAQLANGDYAQALALTSPDSESEDYAFMFNLLMGICAGNTPNNVIDLLRWSDDAHTKFNGREAQKQFLTYCMQKIRTAFMLKQHGNVPQDIASYANRLHWGNIGLLYDEFNLACGHIGANGNARIIFTDLALKVIRHMFVKE